MWCCYWLLVWCRNWWVLGFLVWFMWIVCVGYWVCWFVFRFSIVLGVWRNVWVDCWWCVGMNGMRWCMFIVELYWLLKWYCLNWSWIWMVSEMLWLCYRCWLVILLLWYRRNIGGCFGWLVEVGFYWCNEFVVWVLCSLLVIVILIGSRFCGNNSRWVGI